MHLDQVADWFCGDALLLYWTLLPTPWPSSSWFRLRAKLLNNDQGTVKDFLPTVKKMSKMERPIWMKHLGPCQFDLSAILVSPIFPDIEIPSSDMPYHKLWKDKLVIDQYSKPADAKSKLAGWRKVKSCIYAADAKSNPTYMQPKQS